MHGSYYIGYEINNYRFYRLKATSGTIVGAFNVNFNFRAQFLIKVHNPIKGFAIRKREWI